MEIVCKKAQIYLFKSLKNNDKFVVFCIKLYLIVVMKKIGLKWEYLPRILLGCQENAGPMIHFDSVEIFPTFETKFKLL